MSAMPPSTASIDDALDDGEQVERRAGEAVYPRHHHLVTGLQTFQQVQQLPPAGTFAVY